MLDNLEVWARGWLQRKIFCTVSFVAMDSCEQEADKIISEIEKHVSHQD